MRILVTGSSGHLGEALVRVLRADGADVVGLDVLASPFTDVVGSIADRGVVRRCVEGVDAVLHTATLHKPHVGSHRAQDVRRHERHGHAEPARGGGRGRRRALRLHEHDERLRPRARPAAGRARPPGSPRTSRPCRATSTASTKTAAEDLCELVHRDHGLPCLVLRTSRFFPEADDRDDVRGAYDDANVKVNELLYRRVDLEDVVERAPAARSSARPRSASAATSSARPRRSPGTTSPRCARTRRRSCAGAFPTTRRSTRSCGWTMFPSIERVYVNARARADLGWAPRHDFRHALERLAAGEDPRSPLARAVGAKGYHAVTTGPYTTR